MRHVGGVIYNRFLHDHTSILKVVLQKKQFSFFNDDSTIKSALLSGRPEEVEKWAFDLPGGANGDKERFEECRGVAGELTRNPASNPFVNDPEVQHYLSPSAMKSKFPDWATKDKQFNVPGIADGRFRWYRGVKRGSSK
jgi:hypothetical protein